MPHAAVGANGIKCICLSISGICAVAKLLQRRVGSCFSIDRRDAYMFIFMPSGNHRLRKLRDRIAKAAATCGGD
jgi:hypothetical protein